MSTTLLTAETISDELIRETRRRCMDGSHLAESCDVALGVLVLDGQDEDEPEYARERVAEHLNAQEHLSPAQLLVMA